MENLWHTLFHKELTQLQEEQVATMDPPCCTVASLWLDNRQPITTEGSYVINDGPDDHLSSGCTQVCPCVCVCVYKIEGEIVN